MRKNWIKQNFLSVKNLKRMMLENEPEEDELKVVIGEEDSDLIKRLKEIVEKEKKLKYE